MKLRAFKFLSPLIIFAGAFHAFSVTGWQVWLPLLYTWFLIPLLELCLRPDDRNLDQAGEELARMDRKYDLVLYLVVPLQYAALAGFLYSMRQPGLHWTDITGRIWVMGLLCGVFGINVGHELGHRKNAWEQTLAKLLLLTSQYMHFFIEHNKGHHKRVATPEDPSSARYGEWIYAFYVRTVLFSYLSAWKIAARDTRKAGKAVLSLHNQMIRFTLIQVMFLAAILLLAGWFVLTCYLAAAAIGILLLETVNYIEHYGLQRRPLGMGKYERAGPVHSWNSNHVMGRLMLFELSRHSDHHFLASRKYQLLRHHDDSPQMPTGYPGMMLLSLVPPLWMKVMNKRINSMQKEGQLREVHS